MGRVCGTYCGEQKCVQSFDGESLRKQRQDVVGRIILKWIFKKRLYGVHCIYVVHETDTFLTLANAVLKRRVSSSDVFGTVCLRIPLWDMYGTMSIGIRVPTFRGNLLPSYSRTLRKLV